jgi:hypothetical protein
MLIFRKFWLQLSKIYYLLICDYLATSKSDDQCDTFHTSVDCLHCDTFHTSVDCLHCDTFHTSVDCLHCDMFHTSVDCLHCDMFHTSVDCLHCDTFHTPVDGLCLISVFPKLLYVYKQYLRKKRDVKLLRFNFYVQMDPCIIIQVVPLATEPSISLIILPLMRILQRNLKQTYLIV